MASCTKIPRRKYWQKAASLLWQQQPLLPAPPDREPGGEVCLATAAVSAASGQRCPAASGPLQFPALALAEIPAATNMWTETHAGLGCGISLVGLTRVPRLRGVRGLLLSRANVKESMSGGSGAPHFFPGKLPTMGRVVLGSDLAQMRPNRVVHRPCE